MQHASCGNLKQKWWKNWIIHTKRLTVFEKAQRRHETFDFDLRKTNKIKKIVTLPMADFGHAIEKWYGRSFWHKHLRICRIVYFQCQFSIFRALLHLLIFLLCLQQEIFHQIGVVRNICLNCEFWCFSSILVQGQGLFLW